MNRSLNVLAIATICILGAEAQADFNLTLEGTLATGQSNASEVRGDLAYVVGGRYFNILDIGNPLDINLMSSTELAGVGAGLIVNSDLVYVMEGSTGVSIYGVFDPAAPVLLGSTGTMGSTRAGTLVGSLLYVADQGGGLQVVNVANPTAPLVIGGTPPLPYHNYYDVAVEGSFAYVMSVRTEWDLFYPNLLVFSLANPLAPTLVAMQEYQWQGSIGNVLVHNSVIYMSDGTSTLYSVTYSPEAGLTLLGALDGPMKNIAIDANGVLFASTYREFASVDISQPREMSIISEIPTPRWGGGFNVDGGRAFLPQSDHGAVWLYVDNPAQMHQFGHYWPPGHATSMTYRDGLLVVAGKQTWIVDATDPKNMKSAAENYAGTGDFAAEPGGSGVAYVAGSGVRAVDLATGSTLGSIRPDGQSIDVSFWNDTVYSAQSYAGFAILDFSDPAAPVQTGGFGDYTIRHLAAYGDVLYATGPGTIEAFDVEDPASPVSTFSTPYTDFIGNIVVEGGRLFVCAGDEGVHIFGLENPLSPKHLATIPAQTRCYDVAVRGVMMAIAEPDHGASLYDIRDPSDPVLVGSCARPGRPTKLALADHTLFVSVYEVGIYAYAIGGTVTGAPSLSESGAFLRAETNPTRSVAKFSFGTAWDDEVELAIYDLAGRRVSAFRRRTSPDTPSLIIWNGRDGANRSVASGVYVVRLTTSRTTVTDKITFMR